MNWATEGKAKLKDECGDGFKTHKGNYPLILLAFKANLSASSVAQVISR
jgi:hypothetical protein